MQLIGNNQTMFCFSRKNSIVLRTQLSVRVHAIMGNILFTNLKQIII